jgi:hypothetical protein
MLDEKGIIVIALPDKFTNADLMHLSHGCNIPFIVTNHSMFTSVDNPVCGNVKEVQLHLVRGSTFRLYATNVSNSIQHPKY